MKVWITKYALTKGILEAESSESSEFRTGRKVKVQGQWFYDNDYHVTLKDAQEHAEKMRHNKIASLERSLKKLKNLYFIT